LCAQALGLVGDQAQAWNAFSSNLSKPHIRLNGKRTKQVYNTMLRCVIIFFMPMPIRNPSGGGKKMEEQGSYEVYVASSEQLSTCMGDAI
jgi:hypothetical protein